jgi:chemotaxis protein MotA
MDPGTLIGIAVGFAAILIGMTMEGASLGSLVEPSSAVIVIVGTIGATMGGYLLKDTTGLAGVIKSGLLGKVHQSNDAIRAVVQMAEQARREGLLSLEDAAKKIEDPFLQKGIQMAVDGTDADELREILETEIIAMKGRHKAGAKFFADLGAFAPTLGIIGTVIGLVHMLENLEDPSTAGPAIAVANKLKRVSELEAHHMELLLEGVLSIQAGANPRIIEQKLLSFLAPKQRKLLEASRAA